MIGSTKIDESPIEERQYDCKPGGQTGRFFKPAYPAKIPGKSLYSSSRFGYLFPLSSKADFCVRCDNRKPGGGAQDAGCAVGMECGGNGIANSIEWTWADRSGHEQLGGSAKIAESGVDIVVNTDIDDLHLQAPELIESATRRLHPNDILMIALPLRSHWEILLITMRVWWERWTGGHSQFWSRRRLSALLQSCGFMNLESIKIRASSRRRPIIILVAKKTS